MKRYGGELPGCHYACCKMHSREAAKADKRVERRRGREAANDTEPLLDQGDLDEIEDALEKAC